MTIRKINLEGKRNCDLIRIHLTLPVSLYKDVLRYQKDAVGEPSFSGVTVTALRQLLDMLGYLKS